jgi:hypothetical protein
VIWLRLKTSKTWHQEAAGGFVACVANNSRYKIIRRDNDQVLVHEGDTPPLDGRECKACWNATRNWDAIWQGRTRLRRIRPPRNVYKHNKELE